MAGHWRSFLVPARLLSVARYWVRQKRQKRPNARNLWKAWVSVCRKCPSGCFRNLLAYVPPSYIGADIERGAQARVPTRSRWLRKCRDWNHQQGCSGASPCLQAGWRNAGRWLSAEIHCFFLLFFYTRKSSLFLGLFGKSLEPERPCVACSELGKGMGIKSALGGRLSHIHSSVGKWVHLNPNMFAFGTVCNRLGEIMAQNPSCLFRSPCKTCCSYLPCRIHTEGRSSTSRF